MNVVSLAGKKRDVGENGGGGSGRVRKRHVVKSEFTVTSSGCDLAQRMRFPGAMSDCVEGIRRRRRRWMGIRRWRRRWCIADEGEQSDHGEFPLGQG